MRAIQLTFFIGLLWVLITSTSVIRDYLADESNAYNVAQECASVGGEYVTFKFQSICFMPGTIYKTAED